MLDLDPVRMDKTLLINKAFDLGAKAAKAGKDDAPLQDIEMRAILFDSPSKQQSDMMDAWREGYKAEHRAEEIRGAKAKAYEMGRRDCLGDGKVEAPRKRIAGLVSNMTDVIFCDLLEAYRAGWVSVQQKTT